MYENLEKVKQFYAKRKRLPTYKEMQSMFNYYSGVAVSWLVHNWKKDGILKEENFQLVPTSKFFELPLLGNIKAGYPTTVEECITETVSLDQYLVPNPGHAYLLRVYGDSMVNEGINMGDLVVLDKSRQPHNGDIVAANIDNEWTLKYFFKDEAGVRLVAANPKYPPLLPQESLLIGGVVVSVIRKYY